MSSVLESEGAKRLAALFCHHCELWEQRQLGRCPKGQKNCGAKIGHLYRLNHAYAGLTAGATVGIRDIFWSVEQDYATVTIITDQNQRFGVACTLLEDQSKVEK